MHMYSHKRTQFLDPYVILHTQKDHVNLVQANHTRDYEFRQITLAVNYAFSYMYIDNCSDCLFLKAWELIVNKC